MARRGISFYLQKHGSVGRDDTLLYAEVGVRISDILLIYFKILRRKKKSDKKVNREVELVS